LADDVLEIGSSFDPSGIVRGIKQGEVSLRQFHDVIERTLAALPIS
jgi:hypothetical protein